MDKNSNLAWLDLEMTGLNPKKDSIIEIATVVTDNQLNIIARGPSIAIHSSADVLANMNDWCKKQHKKSGLITRVEQSDVSLEQAEQETLSFLREYVAKGKSPLCGNSICMDRRFLAQYMPDLESFFHYRLLDVSTVKILAKAWYPKMIKFKKQENHLALDDTLESIAELKYYREQLFKNELQERN